MNDIVPIATLVHVIELAVAPVFLLAGIAGFLNVMSARLGRIIDRSRVISGDLGADDSAGLFAKELKLIRRRTTVIHRSIALCTCSALFICVLIVSLFIGGSLNVDIDIFIISCFVLAMVLLIVALLLFLLEIKLATQQLKIW